MSVTPSCRGGLHASDAGATAWAAGPACGRLAGRGAPPEPRRSRCTASRRAAGDDGDGREVRGDRLSSDACSNLLHRLPLRPATRAPPPGRLHRSPRAQGPNNGLDRGREAGKMIGDARARPAQRPRVHGAFRRSRRSAAASRSPSDRIVSVGGDDAVIASAPAGRAAGRRRRAARSCPASSTPTTISRSPAPSSPRSTSGTRASASIAALVARIAEVAERTPDGTWIRAVGMNPEMFRGRPAADPLGPRRGDACPSGPRAAHERSPCAREQPRPRAAGPFRRRA